MEPAAGPPWLAPFAAWATASDPRPVGRLDLGRLNALAEARGLALEGGTPVRFVDAAAAGPMPYELAIAATGEVPTRVDGPGMVHDWFNALCWLRWPAIKARMNRLQAEAIRARPASLAGPRGALRDAITLFDESGALFLADDEGAIASLRGFDWRGLFVARRETFASRVRVLVVGHALLEKLQSPYKALCAHALPVAMALDDVAPGRPDALDRLDAAVAATLDAGALARERLAPLPLLGIPGWWPGNEDPAFYNDASVFRPGRRRSSPQ
ncbi:DUF3025 domain-containing protein [Zeimonas arvi]|uniref:DUF3025 domain-containing protein n=1 Tax=Zeimonas arvi TaxID=2498847 RepID=A0A5C8P6B5_9BURK|nr:DUF3025 domain-containing protein [Zeimonas arvi]TXL68898.1 DUF3025 domain-containing protein [Zeimonas arvi]